jgi:hypothetical protein
MATQSGYVGFRRTRSIARMRLTDQQKDPPRSSLAPSFRLRNVKLVVKSLCQLDINVLSEAELNSQCTARCCSK